MARNRALRILLLPVLAITFLIGWIMYSVGGTRPKKTPYKKAESLTKKPSDLEIGLLAEAEEEPLTVET